MVNTCVRKETKKKGLANGEICFLSHYEMTEVKTKLFLPVMSGASDTVIHMLT